MRVFGKGQKYPASVIKVGAILYRFSAFTDDDGKTSINLEEWHVRSIKRKRGSQSKYGIKRFDAEFNQDKYVNLTHKVKDLTWGKRSRKNGDFGFLPSIPEYYRRQFRVGSDLPTGIYTTPLAALKFAIKDKEDEIRRFADYQKEEDDPEEIALWEESVEESQKELRLLKARLTRLKK